MQKVAAAQKSKDSAAIKATAVAQAQSQVSSISGELSTATAALTQALRDESSSTSGSMVSTTA